VMPTKTQSYTVTSADQRTAIPFKGTGITVTVAAGVLVQDNFVDFANYNSAGGADVSITVPSGSNPPSLCGSGKFAVHPGQWASIQVDHADTGYNCILTASQ
jgi:hypothetical protein